MFDQALLRIILAVVEVSITVEFVGSASHQIMAYIAEAYVFPLAAHPVQLIHSFSHKDSNCLSSHGFQIVLGQTILIAFMQC